MLNKQQRDKNYFDKKINRTHRFVNGPMKGFVINCTKAFDANIRPIHSFSYLRKKKKNISEILLNRHNQRSGFSRILLFANVFLFISFHDRFILVNNGEI